MNLTSDLMVDMDGESGKEFKSFLRHLNVKHSILVDDIERCFSPPTLLLTVP